MTDIDEKQLVLYAQMANLVSLILQWPEINVKDIAENFSKVEIVDHSFALDMSQKYTTFLVPGKKEATRPYPMLHRSVPCIMSGLYCL